MKKHLVWFRSDLRTIDNHALSEACSDSQASVIALFIATPLQWQKHYMSASQAAFIYDHLKLLQNDLAELGIPLIYQQCDDFTDTIEYIKTLCKTESIDKVFYNNQYEFNERQRDALLEEQLLPHTLCEGFDSNLFFPPMTILNGQREMYKVFTPFSKAFLNRLLRTEPSIYPIPQKRHQTVSQQKLIPFDYPLAPYHDLKAGEKAAQERLACFCQEQVADYAITRDIPSLDNTSKLSAYLSVGTLSVRQCFQRLQLEYPLFWQNPNSGAFCWLNELIWREFYHHLLIAYPSLSKNKPFIEWTDAIVWNNDTKAFDLWKEGRTGYPIVDAAMRQLNQTGWMHNRLRMVTASFLVKDLLINWRWGEQYFMSKLTDGNLAANNGGWQWAASTGTDAAPYFRIFNPTTQGERFDPEGKFIRQWIPELSQVPDKYIHTPHLWAEKTGHPLDYPPPMVVHKEAREKTLAAFTQAKTKAAMQ